MFTHGETSPITTQTLYASIHLSRDRLDEDEAIIRPVVHPFARLSFDYLAFVACQGVVDVSLGKQVVSPPSGEEAGFWAEFHPLDSQSDWLSND
jgi:hypothetical protein